MLLAERLLLRTVGLVQIEGTDRIEQVPHGADNSGGVQDVQCRAAGYLTNETVFDLSELPGRLPVDPHHRLAVPAQGDRGLSAWPRRCSRPAVG
jgi:hypothetical protein